MIADMKAFLTEPCAPASCALVLSSRFVKEGKPLRWILCDAPRTADCVLYPDLRDKDLCAAYGARDADDLLARMLTLGEQKRLMRAICALRARGEAAVRQQAEAVKTAYYRGDGDAVLALTLFLRFGIMPSQYFLACAGDRAVVRAALELGLARG